MFSGTSPRDRLCVNFGPVEFQVLTGVYNQKLNFETRSLQEESGPQKKGSHSSGILREILESACWLAGLCRSRHSDGVWHAGVY